MALFPSTPKYRKVQRGSRKGKAGAGNTLANGEYGLQALTSGWVKVNQIEAARIAIHRNLKDKGRVWIRIFADKPVSKKPVETRMGKGKGMPEYWVAVVKKGCMLYEVDGVSEHVARYAMRIASAKLPVKTRFVSRGKHL
jgi:large subunit ribosomal protein L16